jgi:uncharacterized protein
LSVETRPSRPIPLPTRVSKPFWDGCRDGQLLLQLCKGCGAHVFLPREFCPSCRSTDLDWVPSSGRGVITSFTVVGRAQTPAFEVPYVVAVVRLAEGPDMVTNIVEAQPSEIEIGDAVGVRYLPVTADVTLPCFGLVEQNRQTGEM